ncbi:MAG: DUF559 domain-containing protein [Acidimicrobiales bacterium]|nr:DUF559 domain-containing protein [Acidimicrobiales bacterium]
MLPDPVFELLRRQSGLVADHQLLERFAPPIRRRVHRHPDVERITPRVLRHRAAPESAIQTATAAVLDNGPGAALWATSAAAHWGFGPYRLTPAHVAILRCHRGRTPGLGQRHLVGSICDRDRTTLAGVPISRPELTLLWIAGAMTHRLGHDLALLRFSALLDDAWRRRLVDESYIRSLADRSGGKGRSGIVVFRDTIDARPPGYRPAGSRLEERFESTLPWDVHRQLVRQVTVDVEPVVRTVDYRCRGWPLVVEINGETFHSSLTDRTADDERYAHLRSRGFSVVVWWEHDIWHDPETIRQVMTRLVRTPDAAPTLHRPTRSPWE